VLGRRGKTTTLELVSSPYLSDETDLEINLGNVRPAGSPIREFGSITNPDKLLKGERNKILSTGYT